VTTSLIVAMTGATGAVYGVRMLEVLRDLGIRTELIVSDWAATNLRLETGRSVEDITDLASAAYSATNLAAPMSSGSYRVDGMVIVPCSMKTLAAIASGYGDNLVHRAADVTLKEGRKLLVAPRETPFNAIHLRNMLELARLGVTVMPPLPAFYNRPETIDDIIDHFVARALDQFGIDAGITRRWGPVRREDDE
jgi:4-hydroxy-3-polyprenylbenzoate decarboxylase